MSELILYYGRECPHCKAMMPLVERLEREVGIKFEKKEIWHNEKNKKEIKSKRKLIEAACGGEILIPCFYSRKTEAVFCREVPYEKLREWAIKNS
ncbi:hypothetical protein GF345_03795 [Candidatus Woesearchaeota archaeon]|nr:hypothetical protein [Candidatus Woesearchaeota archaeon]